jgi:hypothetical protein
MFNPSNSAYYAIACQIYDRIVQRWQAENRITPQEAQGLLNAKNTAPFMACIEQMDANLPAGTEYQIEQCLVQMVLSPLIDQHRRQLQMMAGRGYGGMQPNPGYGGYGNPGYGPGQGYGYGGRPAYPGYVAPPNPYGQGGAWFSGAPTSQNGNGSNIFNMFKSNPGYRAAQPAPRQPEQKKEEAAAPAPQPSKKWKPPIIDSSTTSKIDSDNQNMIISKFVDYMDSVGIEAFVIDNRPRFLSGTDAIDSYKHLVSGHSGNKFLTVLYKECKLIETGRTEFAALLADVSKIAGNISATDVVARLEAAVNVANDHKASASQAFQKLIVDEFNEHIYAGELTDKDPKRRKLMVKVQNVQGILDLLTNNLDSKTSEILHSIANFESKLVTIVQNILNTLVFGGAQRKLLDPMHDRNCLDIYGKIIPPIWKNAKTGNWVITGNLFTKFMHTKTLEKGAADTAAQAFNQTLLQVDEQYTVVQVPRIITWTNTSSYNIVGWNDAGVCAPTVHNAERGLTSDTAVFLDRTLKRIVASKLTGYQAVTAKLVCEVEEQTRTLDYGLTSDGDGTFWVGSVRFAR